MDFEQTKAAILALPGKESMCRDCADEDGYCPNRLMPCDLSWSQIQSLITHLEGERDALRKALEHYADERNDVCTVKHLHKDCHGYDIARTALKESNDD